MALKPQVELVSTFEKIPRDTTPAAPPWFEDILPYTYRAFMPHSVSARTMVKYTYRAFPVLPPSRP